MSQVLGAQWRKALSMVIIVTDRLVPDHKAAPSLRTSGVEGLTPGCTPNDEWPERLPQPLSPAWPHSRLGSRQSLSKPGTRC